MIYPQKTHAELAQIAKDIVANRVFTNLQVDDPEMVPQIFMILIFMKDADIDALKANMPGLIYEYYSAAINRGINGYPIFLSAHLLSKEDTVTVLALVDKIKAAINDAIQ